VGPAEVMGRQGWIVMADPEGNVFCLDWYPTGSVGTVGLTQPRKRPRCEPTGAARALGRGAT